MANIEAVPAALGLLLRLRNLSQKELAERSGMREEQISRYLSGKVANPGVRQLFRLLGALEVDLTTFGFVVEAVRQVQGVVELRRPEDRRRLNRRVWRALLESVAPPDGHAEAPPAERILRLLGEVENAGDEVATVRRGLVELLAAGDDGPDGGAEG